MSKKKRKDRINVDYDRGVVVQNVGDTCTEFMQIFGANTNLMRHIPTACDGLKISERRILYVMYTMGLKYNSDRTKVNEITGKVALYHPHGDQAIDGTLVRMGQYWSNTQKLIDGKGNYGSPAGDPSAAGRYIEAKLSFYSWKCFFEEYSEDIIDTKLNYLGTKVEPEFLPAKYPNGLINNSFGIGYGIFSGIPTYNFKEVCDATISLIKDDSLDVVLVPDTPFKTYLVDEGQFPSICRNGTGNFKMRGVIDIDEETNTLIIQSCPMLTNWLNVKETIIKLLVDGKKSMIKEIKEYSEKGLDYHITLKREVDPYAIRDLIYSKTQMQKTFSVTFKLIDDYADVDYTLKSYLLSWIDFRRETKRRHYAHRLSELKTREHILEIILFVINKDNAEKTATIFKNSANIKAATESLVKTYKITSMQAEYIAGLGFGALTKDAFARYTAEIKKVRDEAEKVDKLLRSKKKIDKIIIEELEEGIKLFGADRNASLVSIDNETKVRDTNHVVVVTSDGFIKKLDDNINDVGYINSGAYPTDAIHIANTAEIIIFDSKGKLFKLPVHKITGTALASEGIKLNTLCNITGDVVCMKPAFNKDDIENCEVPVYLLMVTKDGFIKKTSLSAYTNIKNELFGIALKDNDALMGCRFLTGDMDIIVYTNTGRGIRFNTSEVRETNRMSIGVKALELEAGESVLGMEIVNKKDKYIFVMTNRGGCKKCTLSSFETMSRYTKPLRITSLEAGDGVSIIKTVKGDETLKVYRKLGVDEIRVKDVPEMTRLGKCKKFIKVNKTDNIINVK